MDARPDALRMGHAERETPTRSSEVELTRFRFPCVDDRGVLVPGGWLTSRRAVRRAGIDAATRRAALRGMHRESGRYGGRMGLFMCVPLLVIVGLFEPAPYVLKIAAVVLLAEAMRSVAWPRSWPRFTAALRTGWLEQGRCPACGCSIAEIGPEQDNCRVCPECGSAWKIKANSPAPTP